MPEGARILGGTDQARCCSPCWRSGPMPPVSRWTIADALAIAGAAEALGVAGKGLIEADWTQADWKAGLAASTWSSPTRPMSKAARHSTTASAATNRMRRCCRPMTRRLPGPDPQLPSLLSPGGATVVEIGWQQAEKSSARWRANAERCSDVP